MRIKLQEKENKHKRSVILLLLLLAVVSVGIGIWTVRFRETETVLAPDYAPAVEKNAESTNDGTDSKLDQPDGGGAVSITYAKDVSVSISKKSATLLFENPAKSNQDMVIQLVIDNTVILQSGKLMPGNRVTDLRLLENAEKRLPEGGYDGKFVVLYYDAESGEKAMVNTEIPVTVTVTD